MAIKIKDIGAIAAKFVKNAGNAVTEYKSGVMDPRRPQNASAIAAEGTWATAVSDPQAKVNLDAGLRRAGESKWQTNASGKGADRYPGGVRDALDAFVTGFGPFASKIASLTLPARGLRRSAQNIDRVRAVDEAMASVKLGKG